MTTIGASTMTIPTSVARLIKETMQDNNQHPLYQCFYLGLSVEEQVMRIAATNGRGLVIVRFTPDWAATPLCTIPERSGIYRFGKTIKTSKRHIAGFREWSDVEVEAAEEPGLHFPTFDRVVPQEGKDTKEGWEIRTVGQYRDLIQHGSRVRRLYVTEPVSLNLDSLPHEMVDYCVRYATTNYQRARGQWGTYVLDHRTEPIKVVIAAAQEGDVY